MGIFGGCRTANHGFLGSLCQMNTTGNATILPVEAIRSYFETDGGRKVTLEELKALTVEDKMELAELAAQALNRLLTS